MSAWSQTLRKAMFLLAATASSFAHADILQEIPLSKDSVLICHSLVVLEGWADGPTHGIIQLTGYLQADSSLAKTRITGAYQAEQDQTWPLSQKNRELPDFNSYQKLRNSFCWFLPMLPVDLELEPSHQTWKGYLKYACDDVVIPSTLEMKCFVKESLH